MSISIEAISYAWFLHYAISSKSKKDCRTYFLFLNETIGFLLSIIRSDEPLM